MPFGDEYKGLPMEKVPARYLLGWRDWVLDQGGPSSSVGKDVLAYVNENHVALEKECEDYDSKHPFSR